MLSATARAETAYVTDKLRLGLHKAADTSDRAFAQLQSGDAVEVLERNRLYGKVRTADGKLGWVRIAYLTGDVPPRRQLQLVEKERDAALARVEQLAASIETRAAELDERERQLDANMAADALAREELMQLRQSTVELRSSLVQYAWNVPVTWALSLAALGVLIGAVSVWWWIDRRLRRRHGGFRIY